MNPRFDYKAKVAELDNLADEEIPVPKRVRDKLVEYFGSRHVDSHGVSTGVGLRLFGFPDGRVNVKKDSLVEWLNEASREPCYCGSGKYYEKCHAEEEIPVMVDSFIHLRTHL